MYFRRVILSAFVVGICAGLFLSAVQALQVTHIIQQAEIYETANRVSTADSTHRTDSLTHEHVKVDQHDHSHNNEAWSPEEGMERLSYTVISNIMAASGFAMLLISLMSFGQKKMTIRTGVLWGLAGFTVFFLSPSLGMRPEIPGAATADLLQRQVWWMTAVVGTAAGLACIVYAKSYYKLLGPLLLVLPHVIAAPQPAETGFDHADAGIVVILENLQQQFLQATALANGTYWIVLGILSALLVMKYVRPSVSPTPK